MSGTDHPGQDEMNLRGVVSAGADLDATFADARLVDRLAVGGGAADHAPVVEVEAGAV